MNDKVESSERAQLDQLKNAITTLEQLGENNERPIRALLEAQTIELDCFARESLGDYFNFQEALPYLKKHQLLLNEIPADQRFLQDLHTQWLTSLRENSESFLKVLRDILLFSPISADGQPSAQGQRDKIIKRARAGFEAAVLNLEPIINRAYRAKNKEDTSYREMADEALREVESYRLRITKELDAARKSVEHTERDIKETESAVRQLASQQGITSEAIHFDTAAGFYRKVSLVWLLGTLFFLVMLGLWGEFLLLDPLGLIVSVYSLPEASQNGAMIQMGLTKLLITTLGFYALVFCANNFKSNSHNYIVNRHRAEALKTYKAMIAAGNGSDNRDIVLMQAAACIYSPQDTGFGSKSSEKNSPTINVPITLPQTLSQ